MGMGMGVGVFKVQIRLSATDHGAVVMLREQGELWPSLSVRKDPPAMFVAVRFLAKQSITS